MFFRNYELTKYYQIFHAKSSQALGIIWMQLGNVPGSSEGERTMAKNNEATIQSKQQPTVTRRGIRVGGGIITAAMPNHRPGNPKAGAKRGVRVGGGIITAAMPS
jgi:hypothetical protein